MALMNAFLAPLPIRCNGVFSAALSSFPALHRHHIPSVPHSSRRSSAVIMTLTEPALKLNQLGSSNLTVTEVCLGTMTWGMQNTEEDAHKQLDYAIKVRRDQYWVLEYIPF